MCIRWESIKKPSVYVLGLFALLLLIVVFWILIVVVIDLYGPSIEPPQLLDTVLSGLGITLNALLTLGLLYLYTKIKNIQELEREPILEIANYEIEGNSVIVWISNYGNGSAVDLEMEFELVGSPELLNDSLDIVEPDNYPIFVESGVNQLQRASDEDLRRETSVPPKTEYVKFQSTPYLRVEDEDGQVRNMDFSAAAKPLSNNGIDEARFCLRLHYQTQLDDQETLPITPFPRGTDIKKLSRFETAVHGRPPQETDASDITVEIKTSAENTEEN